MVHLRGRLRCWRTSNVFSMGIWGKKPFNLIQIRRNSILNEKSQGKWVISLIETGKSMSDSLDSLIQEDFKYVYDRINSTHSKSIIPASLLKLNNYKPFFSSIPNLGPLIEKGFMKEAMDLLIKSFNDEKYLTFEEVQKLIIYSSPYPWYSYEIISIYKNKYNWEESNDQLFPLLMKLAFFNLDYKLFNDIFIEFNKFNSKIPTNLLILSIQVYLKTRDIKMATNLFNQYLMTETHPNYKVLNIFISNLFNLTNNHLLCLKAYKSWITNGFVTDLDIDSFIYNIIFENGSIDEINWIEKSLQDRKLINSIGIKFGMEVCSNYSKDKSKYLELLESEKLNKIELISQREGCYSTILNSLIYLHLRHQNYDEVFKTMDKFESRKDFNLTVFTILNHLEKLERPDLIFQFLKHLRANIKFKFDYRHIIPYWRTMINLYIHSGDRIHKRFLKSIKQSEFKSIEFLLKILKIREMNKSSMSDIRWYPKIQLRTTGKIPISTKPFIENIQNQISNGILPNVNLLWKSISLCKNDDDFNQLIEIINKMESNGITSCKIDIELFWRDRAMGKWKPVDEFINCQVKKLDERMNIKSNDISKDLIDLFQLCVKSNRINEGEIILKKINELQSQLQFNNNQRNLKFLSMYIKWCFLNRKFIDLVVILEWIKKSNLVIDGFFVDGLRKGVDVYIQRMIRIFEEEFKDMEDFPLEKEKLNEILPNVLKYYDSITMDLHKKVRKDRKVMLIECEENFNEFITWLDEDVSELLKSIQDFKKD